MATNQRKTENELAVNATPVAGDFIRLVKSSGGQSQRTTFTDGAAAMEAANLALGFLQAATAEDGLIEKVSVRNEDGNYLVDEDTDSVIWANLSTAGASITYTLPAALSAYDAVNDRGQRFTLKVMVPFAGRTLTIQPQPLELLDTFASMTLAGGTEPVYLTVISNGADWIIVGG